MGNIHPYDSEALRRPVPSCPALALLSKAGHHRQEADEEKPTQPYRAKGAFI